TRMRIDPNNQIPETNENNNTFQLDYVLATGGC
ncbi:MAG: hypothetical protein KC496_16115, partial [Anaerolineae bacterium]|nr:hypothetical protein [Anaerolineae bacterium]